MRYIDEYRQPEIVAYWTNRIHKLVTRRWQIMEVCGGQTHNILKFGLDQLLPPQIEMIHGPGCPVCVTPTYIIDQAIELSLMPNVTLCTFGDMIRVPGSQDSLLLAQSQGGKVKTLYSPLDAVKLARQNPSMHYVFLAIGFETTAPGTALTVKKAAELRLTNFSLLVSHLLVPPAVEAILLSPHNTIQGLLAPGHVCTVTGWIPYESIAQKTGVPIVVTGFEPADILQGIAMVIELLENGLYSTVECQYRRVVKRDGNKEAMRIIDEVFETADQEWRGIGTIPNSGLKIKSHWKRFDAQERFSLEKPQTISPGNQCLAGQVLQGTLKPTQCPLFGNECTPEHPLGAPMVSSEGACAAYFRYKISSAYT